MKNKLSGGPVFTFRLPGGRFAPMPSVSYANAVEPAEFSEIAVDR